MSMLLDHAPRFSSGAALLRHYAKVKQKMAQLAPPPVMALPSPAMMARGNAPGLLLMLRPEPITVPVTYDEAHGAEDIVPNQKSVRSQDLRVLDHVITRVAIARAIYAVNRILAGNGVTHRTTALVQAIAEAFKIDWYILPHAGRHDGAVYVRQIACAIIHRFSNQSLPGIGRALGGRDHTTVLHAARKYAALVEDVARYGANPFGST